MKFAWDDVVILACLAVMALAFGLIHPVAGLLFVGVVGIALALILGASAAGRRIER